MICIHCGSERTQARGKRRYRQFYCVQCKRYFSDKDAPKILLLDIETSHILVSVFRVGEQYVRPERVRQDWFMLCWGAKWLFDDKTFSGCVTPKESINRDDKRITTKIHRLLDQADIVIAHNGKSFDIRRLNYRFLKHGLPPNLPFQVIDTLQASRRAFGSTSHALDWLAHELGYDGKDTMVEEDWDKSEAGDTKALRKMQSYNIKDVLEMERVYLKIRPWILSHPNLAAYVNKYVDIGKGETQCPICRNVISELPKKYRTPSGYVYQAGRCKHCGAIIRRTEREPFQNIQTKRA